MSNKSKFLKSRLARILVALAAVVITIAALELLAKIYTSETDAVKELSPIELAKNIFPEHRLGGGDLRMAAWEASFTERLLTVPKSGPRDGVNGERITKRACGSSSNCTKEIEIQGIVEVDENGFQYIGNKLDPSPSILIIGGSVAWGAGASDINNTYFSKLQKKLKEEYPDIGITVLATYGSTSHTDLNSFVAKGLDINPDIVIFLNGLNDITTKRNPSVQDVGNFYINMENARIISNRNRIVPIFIRQPFPGGKVNKTDFENRILELSNPDYAANITNLYEYVGEGLNKLSISENSYYIDAAGCFDDEKETTFSDQWHFSDPAQKLLTECIYDDLLLILKKIPLR